MKPLLYALILVSLAAPAARAAHPVKAEAPSSTPYINIDPVALPVVADGRVVNYVFVNVRIELTANATAQQTDAVRAKEPYFRDALVRAAHRTPFTVPTDYTVIDQAKLSASLLPAARTITPLATAVKVMAQTPKSTRVAASR